VATAPALDAPVFVAPVLVLGVGSELRGDDAAGRAVADRVASLGLEGVETRSVHQLTPELAADVVGRRLVVVVDAAVGIDEAVVSPVVAAHDGAGVMTHHLDIAAVVGLSGLLGTPPVEVVTVAIPAHDLGLGTELSGATAIAVEEAVERVRQLVG
jgi:hydrogenase maturation protease